MAVSSTSEAGPVQIADNLRVAISVDGSVARLEFAGEITDEIDATPILALDAEYLVFDLAHVERITSFGIREWVKLLGELDVNYYCFVRCPPPLVAQFNMVYDFRGEGEITSLQLPYLCSSCGEEITYLADLRDEYAELSNSEPPPRKCSKCEAEADFDDIPDLYFECIVRQGPPDTPEPVDRVLGERDAAAEGEESGGAEPFRVRKEVVGELTALWGKGAIGPDPRGERIVRGLEEPVLLICSDIASVDPSGLRELIAPADVEFLLARVDPELLEGLADYEEFRRRLSPVTSVVTVRCSNCGWERDQEIELASVVDRDGPDVPQGCPECFGDLAADVSEQARELYRSFGSPTPSAGVRGYLALRDARPGEGAGGEEVETVVGQSFGSYTLGEQIGTGGMADIFLAQQSGPDDFERTVVVKRLRLDTGAAPDSIESFKREAKVAARLDHPNIVHVTDFGRTNQFYYMVMEHVDGPDLGRVLSRIRSLHIQMPLRFATYIAVRMADALHAAHTLCDEEGEVDPLVHRDVSPHNILISTHGIPKLTDFGIARDVATAQEESKNAVRGKVGYLAPEMIHSELGPVDGRSDVFSLGTVLFESLTGKRLFERDSRAETMRAVVTSAPFKMTAVREEIPEELDRVVRKAIAKRPDDRYASARAFQRELEALLDQFGPVRVRELGNWMAELTGTGGEAASDPT